MTLTLKIDPMLEQRLREQAARRGVKPDSYAVSAIEEKVRLDSKVPAPRSRRESELLKEINVGLPEKTWVRYDHLIEKRRAETLTSDEHRELIRLTNSVEEDHAHRMTLLVELARLRNVPLETTMSQLGIQPRRRRSAPDE